MNVLLPCPFCGGEGQLTQEVGDGYDEPQDDAYAHYVCCTSCAARGGWAKSENGAVRSWNLRNKEARKDIPATAIKKKNPKKPKKRGG